MLCLGHCQQLLPELPVALRHGFACSGHRGLEHRHKMREQLGESHWNSGEDVPETHQGNSAGKKAMSLWQSHGIFQSSKANVVTFNSLLVLQEWPQAMHWLSRSALVDARSFSSSMSAGQKALQWSKARENWGCGPQLCQCSWRIFHDILRV